MRFQVREDGKPLFDEIIAPDHRFHDFELPLTGAPGQHVRLTLAAERPGHANAHLTSESVGGWDHPGETRGLWLDPRVMGGSSAPNILLVTIDALRPDHLSAYGYGRDTSPTLDKLIRLGARFDRSTAQAGSTWESCTSLLSGLYPAHTGVHTRGQVPRPDVAFLPDLLAARGYETFAGATGADFPPWMLTAFDDIELLRKTGNGADIPQRVPSLLARQVAAEVHHAGGHPLFLWVHLDHPHYPLTPSQPLRYDPGYTGRFADGFTLSDHERTSFASVTSVEGKHIAALYDAAVRDADDSLGAILGVLNEADLLQNTIVVVTADHGEMIGSRDLVLEHTAPFNDVLHVPLVIAWPAAISPREPIGERVQSIDLPPTLLSLAGLPAAAGLDGRDLSPLLRGGTLEDRPAYSETGGILSRYDRDAHFIYNPNHFGLGYYYHSGLIPVAEQELFDLSRDPQERYDLASTHPEQLRKEREDLLRDIGAWLDPDASDSSRELGQDALDALRNAGYLHETATTRAVSAQPSVSTPK
jgi:arylsulfatase A-like enzyme